MNTRELKKQLSQIETQLAEIVGDHKIDTPKRLRSFLFEVLQLPSEGLLSTKGGVPPECAIDCKEDVHLVFDPRRLH